MRPVVGFSSAGLDERLLWVSPPSRWEVRDGCLVVEPDAGTDFWQGTRDGLRRDGGHLLAVAVDGDVEIGVTVTADPRHQQDQAGVMLRVSERCWVKASVEHDPAGPDRLTVVVTNGGWSDRSTQGTSAREVELRLHRRGNDVTVDARAPGASWSQVRLAHLHEGGPALVGVYACSPADPGFVASFRDLRIGSSGPDAL